MPYLSKCVPNPWRIFILFASWAFPASGDTLYWGQANYSSGSFATASNWFTDSSGTLVSAATPVLADDVIFNTTPNNSLGGTVLAGAHISANSFTFNTTGATLLSQGGVNRTLTLGTGGITLASGAGNATFGTSTNTLSVQLTGNQSWTNQSSSTLNVRSLRPSDAASGPVSLTLNAASSGSITFSLAMNNSPDTLKSLGLVIDSTGSGTVSMPNSLYAGGTLIKRGVVSSSGSLGSGSVTLGDTSGAEAARLHLSGIATNAITVQAGSSGLAALTGATGSDFQGDISVNRDVSLGSVAASGQSVLFSGEISGTGDLTIGRVASGSSNPTVTLSGANTFLGRTIVESATLVVHSINSVSGGSASSSLGAAPLSVAQGTISMGLVSSSTLRYVGTGETTDRVIDLAGNTTSVTLEQSGTGLLKFLSDFSTTGSGNKTVVLSGSTAGSGELSGLIANSTGTTSISKTGSGTWRLSGLNTYTGNTVISGGVLELTTMSNGGLPSSMGADTTSSSNLTMSGGGTLRYVGGTNALTNRLFTVGSGGAVFDASGGGTLSFTNTTAPSYGSSNTPYMITLQGSNTGNNSFAANLANNGFGAISLTKTGSGRWVLTGTTTHTGATTLNQGTFVVNGSTAAGSAVALNSAVLAGTGTIHGLVSTASTDSMISPGNSPGTLNLHGGLNAATGATFVFELGTNSDLISLGSGIFTGSSVNDGLLFHFSDAGGLSAATPYTLFTFASTSNLETSDLLGTIMPAGYILDPAFGDGGFELSGTDLRVQFAMIPEPRASHLLALFVGGWGFRRSGVRNHKLHT